MSPYENEIRITKTFRTGLLAAVSPGHGAALAAELQQPHPGLAGKLAEQAIHNLSVFTKPLAGSEWCVVYFDYRGHEREEAAAALARSSSWWNGVARHLTPHPRAAQLETRLLRMEWITHVGGAESKPAERLDRHLVVTRLRPEKELWYRTLHQTNWPGVGDQMSRSNIRHWTTFLTDIGPELYMFSYYEYIGANLDADTEAMKADAVTQRWWTHTEPCLDPLPEIAGKGSWAETTRLAQVG